MENTYLVVCPIHVHGIGQTINSPDAVRGYVCGYVRAWVGVCVVVSDHIEVSAVNDL